MKGHVQIETVRQWLELLEDGQTHEVYCLMLAELELVGRTAVAEVPEAQPAEEDGAPVDPVEVEKAKSEMKKRGHSYKSAGEVLGVHLQRVYKVLNGRETSARILEGIYSLPQRQPKAYVVKRGDYPELAKGAKS